MRILLACSCLQIGYLVPENVNQLFLSKVGSACMHASHIDYLGAPEILRPFHMRVQIQSFEMKLKFCWNFAIPDSLKTSKTNFELRFSGVSSKVPMPAKRNFEVSIQSFSRYQILGMCNQDS